MEINLSIHKVWSMAEKGGDECADYFLPFMIIKQKFLIFKIGHR